MIVRARVFEEDSVSSLRDYGMEEPWFCEDAAALTGLKYGCAIASLAVNRSWMQVSFVMMDHQSKSQEINIPDDHNVVACPKSLWHRC